MKEPKAGPQPDGSYILDDSHNEIEPTAVDLKDPVLRAFFEGMHKPRGEPVAEPEPEFVGS